MKKVIRAIAALLCATTLTMAGCAGGSIPQWVKEQQCVDHVWNEGEVTVEATCAAEGEKTFTCAECGKKRKEKLKQLPHVEEIVDSVAATCETAGSTYGIRCTVCKVYVLEPKTIAALGHNLITVEGYEATCEKDGLTDGKYCGRCNEILIAQEVIHSSLDKHRFVYSEGFAATCTEYGYTGGTYCEVCSYPESGEPILPTGHSYDESGFCKNCGMER